MAIDERSNGLKPFAWWRRRQLAAARAEERPALSSLVSPQGDLAEGHLAQGFSPLPEGPLSKGNKEYRLHSENPGRMKQTRLLLAAALLLLSLMVPGTAKPLDLFVSPQGHDTASGTLAAPLATLKGARDRIRALNQAKRLPPDGVTVLMLPGTYQLKNTFTLTRADQTSVPVTYEAFVVHPAGTVRLTGGAEVKGWKPVTDPAILNRLDPAARGQVLQTDLKAQGITDYGQMTGRGFGRPLTPAGLELFFHDAPMTLARWPNAGQWASIAGTPAGQDGDRFSYGGDRPARWAQDDDVWVHGYWTLRLGRYV